MYDFYNTMKFGFILVNFSFLDQVQKGGHERQEDRGSEDTSIAAYAVIRE
jgi:hypothetical protein